MLNVLEDFGGFSGSIIMVFGFLMSFYAERFYQDSISGEIPLEAGSFSAQTKRNAGTFFQKFSSPPPVAAGE